MSRSAFRITADDSADLQIQLIQTVLIFDFAMVVSVNIHSCFLTAGTGNGQRIDRIDQIVVVRLCDIRYHYGKNNNHGEIVQNEEMVSHILGGKNRRKPSFLFSDPFCFQNIVIHDNMKS